MAVMGGPSNNPSFTENIPNRSYTGYSFIGNNYYTQSYSNSVKYNCLVLVPYTVLTFEAEPGPLTSYQESISVTNAGTELEELIETAQFVKENGNWTAGSLEQLENAVSEAVLCLQKDDRTVEDLAAAGDRIRAALSGLVRVKHAQEITVSAPSQTLKVTDLKTGDQILDAVTVENIKGEVSFKLKSVSNEKYADKFKINEDKGIVTVKKGLPAGNYALAVQVTSAGNEEYYPVTMTAVMNITVSKEAQKMTASAKTQTVKAKDLVSKNKVLNPITVKNAKGDVTYQLSSVNQAKYAKKFSVSKTTGKITLKKGLPIGTYILAIKATAAGNSTYKAKTATVKVKINVK